MRNSWKARRNSLAKIRRKELLLKVVLPAVMQRRSAERA
jgi:hypothetical protein